MNYLIDTHTLIWYAEGDKRLPDRIRNLIDDHNNNVFVSYASIWEMSIKISISKLTLKIPLTHWESLLQENGFSLLTPNFQHFERLIILPFHHNDPFDRLIIAQALTDNLTLITYDSQFSKYQLALEAF